MMKRRPAHSTRAADAGSPGDRSRWNAWKTGLFPRHFG